MEIIIIIFFVILLSFLLSKILEYIKIPKIIAPLFVGMIFNYYMHDLIYNYAEIFQILSDLGIIMLLFYTGLELNLKVNRKLGTETLLVAILGIIFSFGICFLFGYYILDYSFIVSFVVSATLSITAQGVVAILLDEAKLIKNKIGEIILGAGVIDDIFGIFLLFAISLLINTQKFTFAFIKPFLIGFVIMFIIFKSFNRIKNLLGEIFLYEEKDNLYDVFTLALIVVFALASISGIIGFDFSIGAILAGIILNLSLKSKGKEGTHEEHIINKFIKAISFGFLNYFFFFWIGFKVDISAIFNNPTLGILLCLIGFTGKFFAGLFAAYLSKDKMRNGTLIGIGMVTKGGVGLVMAEIANKSGYLTPEIFSSIIFMEVILTIIPPILFNYYVKKIENN